MLVSYRPSVRLLPPDEDLGEKHLASVAHIPSARHTQASREVSGEAAASGCERTCRVPEKVLVCFSKHSWWESSTVRTVVQFSLWPSHDPRAFAKGRVTEQGNVSSSVLPGQACCVGGSTRIATQCPGQKTEQWHAFCSVPPIIPASSLHVMKPKLFPSRSLGTNQETWPWIHGAAQSWSCTTFHPRVTFVAPTAAGGTHWHFKSTHICINSDSVPSRDTGRQWVFSPCCRRTLASVHGSFWRSLRKCSPCIVHCNGVLATGILTLPQRASLSSISGLRTSELIQIHALVENPAFPLKGPTFSFCLWDFNFHLLLNWATRKWTVYLSLLGRPLSVSDSSKDPDCLALLLTSGITSTLLRGVIPQEKCLTLEWMSFVTL